MDAEELRKMALKVAKEYERKSGTTVTAEAAEALAAPGFSHLDQITADLESGKITKDFLEDEVLRDVLANAEEYAREQGGEQIDRPAVDWATQPTDGPHRPKCNYYPWC